MFLHDDLSRSVCWLAAVGQNQYTNPPTYELVPVCVCAAGGTIRLKLVLPHSITVLSISSPLEISTHAAKNPNPVHACQQPPLTGHGVSCIT
jgi:hypothetical protein